MKHPDVSAKIQEIGRTHPLFPKRLLSLEHCPKSLFYRGTLPSEERPTVAIVGSRRCSPYGRVQAFRFAQVLSRHGVQIISGLAIGIDTEGHKGALQGQSPTFAVLGSGLDVIYPPGNRRLYERILEEGGGILSEYPPGSEPLAYHFPVRNRIISGLADLVLVVEATPKSGSLITANLALEQGKLVYALPGPVQTPSSQGTNQLLFDGAGVALGPECILAELGIPFMEEPNPSKA